MCYELVVKSDNNDRKRAPPGISRACLLYLEKMNDDREIILVNVILPSIEQVSRKFSGIDTNKK